MLKSNLCDYSDAYILVSGTITIDGVKDDDNEKQIDERNTGLIFENCATFTGCISEIDNTQIDNAKDLDVVMPMYNSIGYSDNYSKTSGSLWQYYRDDPNDILTNSKSFKFKMKITGKIPAVGNTKDVKIAAQLKYLSNFWRTLEMSLITCEINLVSIWSADCVISSAAGETKLVITDTKLYVSILTLSTQDNAKLLEQLKFGFKGTINWNKCQLKVSRETQNQYLDFLIDPIFQGVNRYFVLLFENENNSNAQKTKLKITAL